MNNTFDWATISPGPLDPDDFNLDDLHDIDDLGEVLIEASWFVDNSDAPVTWGGSNRVVDVGGGRWLLIQDGDDELLVEVIAAPSPGPEAASVIAGFIGDRYERAAAFEFEEFDPNGTLDPAVRKRLQDAIYNSTNESYTDSPESVHSSLDSATRAALQEEFRSWRSTYYDAWVALSHPAHESSAPFFIDLLAEQGIKASREHLPDTDAADDHAIAWTHQALRDRIEREGR